MLVNCISTSIDWSAIASIFTAIISIIVAITALYRSSKYSEKNINLSIQQALFKMVQEKAKDCNTAWDNEPQNEMNDTSPHFLITTEIIIAIEVFDKAFELFGKNYKSLKYEKKDYYYLYWKQLKPDVRGWAKERTQEIAKRFNDVYKQQINTIHSTFGEYF
jgi:hypothetical protein